MLIVENSKNLDKVISKFKILEISKYWDKFKKIGQSY